MFKYISKTTPKIFVRLPFMMQKDGRYCVQEKNWNDFVAKLPIPPYTPSKISNLFMEMKQPEIANAIPLIFNEADTGILKCNEYLKDDGAFNYILEESKKLVDYTDELIPYLESQCNCEISLSRGLIKCLLSHLLLGTFTSHPENCSTFKFYFLGKNYQKRKNLIPHKIAGMFQYFKCMQNDDLHNKEGKYLRIIRKVLPSPIDWSKIDMNLCNISVNKDGSITDRIDTIHSIFANKRVGGGVLSFGMVQEKILEMKAPETLIGVLLCEIMKDNEAVYIQGYEEFNNYEGYGDKTVLNGISKDKSPVEDRIIQNDFILFDALHFTYTGYVIDDKKSFQFSKTCVDRELNKAYIAFVTDEKISKKNVISTGNWGCGVYHGNHELKCLLQWMACSVANNNRITMEYYPFHDVKIEPSLDDFLKYDYSKVKINQLYNWILEYGDKIQNNKKMNESLFKFIERKLL